MMLYVKVCLTHLSYYSLILLNDHFDKMYHTNVADKQLCIKPGVSGFFTSFPLTQEKVETC